MYKNLNQAYIAIEGLPGTGKSFVAKKLAKKLGSRILLDEYNENPFLQNFYNDPEKYDLSTQMFFLINRYNQQLKIPAGDLFQQGIVTNYLFEKDHIYARFNLDEKKYTLYNKIAKALNKNIIIPDLVIYLYSDNNVNLFGNIISKNRPFEKNVTEEYVENLNKAFNYFFKRYDDTSVLIVNINEIDLTDNSIFEKMYEEMQNGIVNVKYFSV